MKDRDVLHYKHNSMNLFIKPYMVSNLALISTVHAQTP